MPAVRERVGDIPLLIQYFLEELKKNLNADTDGVSDEAMKLLCKYPWPGNVRELRNIIERMLVLYGREDRIQAANLPAEFHDGEISSVGHAIPVSMGGTTLQESVNIYEKRIIEDALLEAGGIQTHAAEILGCTRRILRYRMEKLGLT